MIAFLRLAVIGFVVLTVVYWLISLYSRSVRREALEKRWDEGEGDAAGGRDAYIEAGMRAYERGLRRRLIGLVYIVPAVVVVLLIWLNNYS